MADCQTTTATSPELNRPLRSEAEAKAAAELVDISMSVHNAIQYLDNFENMLICMAAGQEDENLRGLFWVLSDAFGQYLMELRRQYNRLEAAAGAS